MGRGDSALAHVGLAPVSVDALRRFLEIERRYLTGQGVSINEVAQGPFRRIGSDLPLGHAPEESRMMWLEELRQLGVEVPSRPVPIWVAATGPKVIELSAELCDRVTFAVGADPGRLRWAIDMARAVPPGVGPRCLRDRRRGGRFRPGVGPLPGRDRHLCPLLGDARHLHGTLEEGDEKVILEVPKAYDMNQHARRGPQGDVITREFAERFAIIGPASRCVERLQELVELGITRFHVGGASRGENPEMTDAINRRFVEQVMPRLAG